MIKISDHVKANIHDPIDNEERVCRQLLSPYRHTKIRHRAGEILRGKTYSQSELRAEFSKFLTTEWIVRDLLTLQKNKDKWTNFITLTWFILNVSLSI